MKIIVILMLHIAVASFSWASPSRDVKPFNYALYGGEKYCLKSDFDGNGISDYVVTLGEGWIQVILNYGCKEERRFDIDAGGVAELYSARKVAGENGEPAVMHPSILVRWVGQSHVVFTWNGNEFSKIEFPASKAVR